MSGTVAAQVVSGRPDPGLLDALALAASYADELVVGAARETHLAVAARVFDAAAATGPVGAAVRQVHDGVATGVYNSIGTALRLTGSGLSRAARQGLGPRLEAGAGGRVVHSAVNGLFGERLADQHPRLAVTLSVRRDGRLVGTDAASLAQAFPDATPRVVVFLHGLGEHEEHWAHRSHETGGTYGSFLAAAAGWTPVYLRANTGIPVAENGVALTSLLQELHDHWPVEVRRIALVGHSMGGLVLRAGCAVATGHDRPWVDRLSDVVTLGTPHLGADLALGVRHGSRLLGLLPESAAFGRILDHRSPGIRDLERGLPELPGLPHVRYRLVSASLGSERSPLGWLLGDLVVRRASATGARRRALRLFPDADVLHVTGTSHVGLLNHPRVYDALRAWLA